MSHPTRFGSLSVTALPASAELEVSLEPRLASRQPQSRSRARARSSSGSETKGRKAFSGSVLSADQRCTTHPKVLKALSPFQSARSQTRRFRVPRSRFTRNESTAGYPCLRISSTCPRVGHLRRSARLVWSGSTERSTPNRGLFKASLDYPTACGRYRSDFSSEFVKACATPARAASPPPRTPARKGRHRTTLNSSGRSRSQLNLPGSSRCRKMCVAHSQTLARHGHPSLPLRASQRPVITSASCRPGQVETYCAAP